MVTLTVPVASDPGDSPSPDSRFGEFGYVDKTGCWRTVIQIFNNSLHSQSSRRIDPDSTESQRETSRTEVCELLKRITALRKTTANSIRDVWRFTHPLTAAWNNLNPLRDNPALQHWGVLVSDIDNKMLEAAVQHRKELRKKKKGWGLGIIHELNRVGKQSAYRVYKWMSNAIKGGYRFIRVGKTKLNNDEILSKGMACSRAFRY